MSDDTPTQRLPSPGGDEVPPRRSRKLLIGLIAAGVLLLIAAIVVIALLAGGTRPTVATTDTATPTAQTSPSTSATPSSEPSTTSGPTTAPNPPSTAVKIDSFVAGSQTVFCNTSTEGGQPHNQYLTFSWKTTNADTVTIGTYDPYGDYSGMYYNLPSDGTSAGAGLQITYNCPEKTQTWRLEATGGGKTVKQEITITNTGDTQ